MTSFWEEDSICVYLRMDCEGGTEKTRWKQRDPVKKLLFGE